MSSTQTDLTLTQQKIIDCARDLVLCWRMRADVYTHALALRGYVEQLELLEQNEKLEVFSEPTRLIDQQTERLPIWRKMMRRFYRA